MSQETNHNPKNSRAWLVIDPPDGKIPPQTAEARARNAARAKARQGRKELGPDRGNQGAAGGEP